MPNDEMYTPKWIFDALGVEFDLDVAGTHSPFAVVPTKQKFTISDNALIQEWHGRVWMNPPYSKVTPWITKWLGHANGFCLVPLSSNGRWVNTLWESDAALVYLPANMPFIGGRDGGKAIMRWRTALWAIGEDNIEILRQSKIGKVR